MFFLLFPQKRLYFPDGAVHCNDVFRRYVRLNIVHLIEDETAAGLQDIYARIVFQSFSIL